MAIKVSYVAKESVNNLRRNLLMTLAALLTIVISLSLAGAALLFRRAVSNATVQFKKGFDVTVFMKPDATKAQVDAINRELNAMPELSKVEYVDKEESFKYVQRQFRNQPEFLAGIPTAADAPEQFRLRPKNADQIDTIGTRFSKRPGVYSVSYFKSVKRILSYANSVQVVILGVAAALMVSAIVLILNTIRMAIFARRREVAVMKLVGATNAFIRLPFMVEGMLQGLIGAAAGFGVLALGTALVQGKLRNGSVQILKSLSVTTGELVGTGVAMLIVGAAVGAVGSALAVSRFLDV
jgi:cell division transport system permease protein